MKKIELENALYNAILVIVQDREMFGHSREESIEETCKTIGITVKDFDNLRHE